jgi:hypothetical protein
MICILAQLLLRVSNDVDAKANLKVAPTNSHVSVYRRLLFGLGRNSGE